MRSNNLGSAHLTLATGKHFFLRKKTLKEQQKSKERKTMNLQSLEIKTALHMKDFHETLWVNVFHC